MMIMMMMMIMIITMMMIMMIIIIIIIISHFPKRYSFLRRITPNTHFSYVVFFLIQSDTKKGNF